MHQIYSEWHKQYKSHKSKLSNTDQTMLVNEAINRMAGSGIFYFLGSERKQWKIKDLTMVILCNKELQHTYLFHHTWFKHTLLYNPIQKVWSQFLSNNTD